jgi:hypothetical protein
MNTTELAQNTVPGTFNFFDPQQFETMQRVCQMFSSSELVPKMYQQTKESTPEQKGKAIANCMIAVETAQRIGASPLMVMQNMYIVYGQPAWSAKFLIATVNSCGRYNSLKYKWENLGMVNIPNTKENIENWQCTAYASEKGSNEILEGVPVSIEIAIKEGWYTKNGSKWKTIPRLMLQYRAATFWARAYAPELSMGLKTDDEIHDIVDVDYEDVSTKVEREKTEKANKTAIGFEPETAETSQENRAPEQSPKSEPETESEKGQSNLPGF